MCQLFEIINKEENGDSMKCPDKMNDLKPISFKAFKGGKVEDSFPNVFLFAVKYKNGVQTGKVLTSAEIFVGDKKDTNNLMNIRLNQIQNENYHKCENIQ